MKQPILSRAASLCAVPALALLALPAAAHTGGGAAAAGFSAGLIHPFTGFDHLLAMLAVGMISARKQNGQQSGKARPPMFLFLLLMALGAASGAAGLLLPGLEIGLAATVALAGLALAVAAPLPARLATVLIAVFALVHGNAHGHELPHWAAAAGFLAASALLLGAGRFAGLNLTPRLSRMAGAAIAASGMMLLGMQA